MIEELVGRHTEISVMLENFYKIQEPDLNHPRIVLIEGEAGIGKTRFTHELKTILKLRGIIFFEGDLKNFQKILHPFL